MAASSALAWLGGAEETPTNKEAVETPTNKVVASLTADSWADASEPVWPGYGYEAVETPAYPSRPTTYRAADHHPVAPPPPPPEVAKSSMTESHFFEPSGAPFKGIAASLGIGQSPLRLLQGTWVDWEKRSRWYTVNGEICRVRGYQPGRPIGESSKGTYRIVVIDDGVYWGTNQAYVLKWLANGDIIEWQSTDRHRRGFWWYRYTEDDAAAAQWSGSTWRETVADNTWVNEQSEHNRSDPSALLDLIVKRVGADGEKLSNVAGRFGVRFKAIGYEGGTFPDFINSSGVLVISDEYVYRVGYEHSRWRLAGKAKANGKRGEGKAGGKKGKRKDDENGDQAEEEEEEEEEDDDDESSPSDDEDEDKEESDDSREKAKGKGKRKGKEKSKDKGGAGKATDKGKAGKGGNDSAALLEEIVRFIGKSADTTISVLGMKFAPSFNNVVRTNTGRNDGSFKAWLSSSGRFQFVPHESRHNLCYVKVRR
jgi:hypothetical protein